MALTLTTVAFMEVVQLVSLMRHWGLRPPSWELVLSRDKRLCILLGQWKQATADCMSQDPRRMGDHFLRNVFEEPVKWRETRRMKVMSSRMLEFPG